MLRDTRGCYEGSKATFGKNKMALAMFLKITSVLKREQQTIFAVTFVSTPFVPTTFVLGFDN